MRSRSFLVLVAVFLICETLVAQRPEKLRGLKGQGQDPVAGQAEGEGPVKVEILDIGQDLVKSQDPVEGQDPVQAQLPDKVQDPVKAQPAVQGVFPFSKLGFCPRIEIRCRLLNPNRCLIDAQCPGFQKCCRVCGVKSCADPRAAPATCEVPRPGVKSKL